MKKEYNVQGMSCGHCRKSVENALNAIEGVNATVTLEPPVATVEFTGEALPLEALQKAISSKAGDFTITEQNS